MSMWWMEPGWKDARCAQCGTNIASTGGDPDWGLCWPCMQHRTEKREAERNAEREYYAEIERQHYAQMAADAEYESWNEPSSTRNEK